MLRARKSRIKKNVGIGIKQKTTTTKILPKKRLLDDKLYFPLHMMKNTHIFLVVYRAFYCRRFILLLFDYNCFTRSLCCVSLLLSPILVFFFTYFGRSKKNCFGKIPTKKMLFAYYIRRRILFQGNVKWAVSR